MRLRNRRTRSLHAQDIASATYTFASQEAEAAEAGALNHDPTALEYLRQRDPARYPIRLDLRDNPTPAQRIPQARRGWEQLIRRVTTSQLRSFINPEEGMNIIQNQMSQQMTSLIERQYPDTSSHEWNYYFNVGEDTFNQETVLHLTARRHHR